MHMVQLGAPWCSLTLIWLASWASGEFTWPTDGQLRTSFLHKRGLALYGKDNIDKIAKMKARCVSALVQRQVAATFGCCQEGGSLYDEVV